MIYRLFSLHLVLVAVGLLLFKTGCRTAGMYTSNPRDKMAFAGTQFELTKSDSFYLTSWTDNFIRLFDENGNQIFERDNQYRGYGTYQCSGDSLSLHFCNEDSITVQLGINRLDSIVNLSIYIYDEQGMLLHPDVDLLDEEGIKVQRLFNEYKDVFNFEIDSKDKPSLMKLKSRWLNIENPTVDLSVLEDGDHTIKRKSYNGYFAKGVRTIWFKRRPTGIRYKLKDKVRYLPKKWKWNWINKLYRDY